MDGVLCKKQLVTTFLKVITAMNPANLISENFKLDKNILYVCEKSYEIKDRNINLIGFGKAVLGMASECEKILGKHLKRGVICVPEGTQKKFNNIPHFSLQSNSIVQVYEGAKNNIPDENSVKGTDAIINLIASLDHKKDYVIVLISGGGSALLTKPPVGMTLKEKQKLIRLLSNSGADIVELNTVRKKLSLVKGGNLANLLFPITTICLILSDVVNDSLDIIASGPTVPNTDSDSAALNIIKKYQLTDKIPLNVLELLKSKNTSKQVLVENNKFPHTDNIIIGNNAKALNIFKQFLEKIGFKTVILSSKIQGLVHNVANLYECILIEIINFIENNDKNNISLLQETISFSDDIFSDKFLFKSIKIMKEELSKNKKVVLIAGGETVVNVQGDGKGGRNQELALIMLQKIYDLKSKFLHFFSEYEVIFFSAGTDGMDGPTDVAGVVFDSKIFEESLVNTSNINQYLSNNDSYNFFANLLDDSYLIRTGHTGTNVMDIHLLAIHEKTKEKQ